MIIMVMLKTRRRAGSWMHVFPEAAVLGSLLSHAQVKHLFMLIETDLD